LKGSQILDVDEYQEHAAKTIDEKNDLFFLYKLVEEVNEVFKELYHVEKLDLEPNKDMDIKSLTLELGDCIRNIAQIATLSDIKMSDIIEANRNKMDERANNNQI
jgi:NTP pyrophosphatase (non-canonical NTP hydrolase)